MDYVARKTQEFQEKKNATQNLVPRDQIERMHILWKKGRNMLASFFTEIDTIRRQINNDAMFSDWCFFQLGIGVNGLGEVAAALRRDDAERIRNDFADAKKIEKERLAAEVHTRRMEAQERKNALAAKKAENVAEAAKAKKAERAAENKQRREEKAVKQGDALTRAKLAWIENPNATLDAIRKIAYCDNGTAGHSRKLLETEGLLAPKSTASSEGAFYEQWVEEGRSMTKARWTLGDLAIKVSKLKIYGSGTLERYAHDINIEYKTLLDYQGVAKAWPEISGRPEFSVASALRNHPDRADIVAREPYMTVDESREIMRKYRAITNVVPLTGKV